MKFLNATATMSRVIRTIALKSRDVYSAPSVAFHIYGYAPIGARLRQDGVRLLSLSFSPHPHPSISALHFCSHELWDLFWHQDCCQYHQAKDGDGWVEYRGSLVFECPQKVIYIYILWVCILKYMYVKFHHIITTSIIKPNTTMLN